MSSAPAASIQRYLLAGQLVTSDARADWLRPFLDREVPPPFRSGRPVQDGPGRIVYAGPGIAGGTLREVRCRRQGSAFLLEIQGGSPVLVDEGGDQVARLAPPGAAPSELDLEISFGPGLVLALALRGVFCFHASCVRFGRRLAAFIGDSGSGKSTIARLARGSAGRERLADDVLPAVVVAGEVFVLPRFPQLKLSPDEQWGADRPERLPLDAIYDVGAERPESETAGLRWIRPVGQREAVLRLARRTVASRLFDAPLTDRQLEACSEIAERVPVRDLVYGRNFEEMPAVFAAVEADLERPGQR